MREIIIIGAGGHGVEMALLARRCGRKVRGFLDNTNDKQGETISQVPVLGKIETRNTYVDCDFLIAIGSPRGRERVIRDFFSGYEYQFATLIDPTAIIGENVVIEEGSMICAGSVLTINITIGKHSIVNINSTLSHGVQLGSFVTIAPNVAIAGDVKIDDLVEIGLNASLKEKLVVARGAFVGMGAVLVKSVEENHVMVGNPAKFLKILD
mgnify:CR=1 FL=1